MEDDPTNKDIKVDENRTLTVFRDNDKMVYYMGLLTLIAGPTDISYGKGIRKELLKRKVSS
jgi:hypothetical protein